MKYFKKLLNILIDIISVDISHGTNFPVPFGENKPIKYVRKDD